MKQNIAEQLEEIEKLIRKSKDYWRFNYSVGLSNGSCYGSNYENKVREHKSFGQSKLKKEKKK